MMMKTIIWTKDGSAWRSADGRFYISSDRGGKWNLIDKVTGRHNTCLMLRSAKRVACLRVRAENRPAVPMKAHQETMVKQKLTPAEERSAVADFVDHRFPDGAPDGFMEGCQIDYYQDEAGRWCYQITDSRGYGDGTGESHPIGD